MKWDLAFYLNPNSAERRSIMRELADAGIRQIGIDGTGWDPETDLKGIEDFRRDIEEFGLALYSMHACSSILATADKDTPPELLSDQLKELKRFSLLGGKTAVYHACWMRDVNFVDIDREVERVGWQPFVERNAKTIKILAKEAAKSGITIVLENIPLSVYSGSFSGFKDILQAVDEPNVGLILDSGHANLAGKRVADEIRFAGKLLRDTHFHDNSGPIPGAFNDQHLPPGLGTIDWQEAIKALAEIKYPGPIVFEGVLGPGDSIENGRFGGKLSHRDLINITINNWRAFEALVANN